MAHDCNSGFCTSRRDLVKMGAAGLTWGLFGLSLPNVLFMREAQASVPMDTTIQRYDAIIQIFYSGGPSQTDTWDPKPGSKNNIFNTIDTGAKDVYGNKFLVAQHFPGLVSLLNDPAFGLGVIRSMTHGNGNHGTAEQYMNNFWGNPLTNNYPSTAAAFAYYFQGTGLGIPSVLIAGNNGNGANTANGSTCPTALNVQVGGNQGQNPTVQALNLPPNTDATRYARRRRLMEAVNANELKTRPDLNVAAYDAAWKQAYDITTQGQAAKAFDLTGKPILPGGPNANKNDLMGITLAQNLVEAGIPYVACGIGGNDTHSGNRQGVTSNWADTTDVPLTQMAKNLKASGKRVLVVMGGEFGRTPNSVANGRDGRDHYADGFSWAMLSINQPAFKTTAIGDTGPDGVFTAANNTMKDPIYPKDLGALIYTTMGFLPGNSPKTDIPTAARAAPPVDRVNNGALLLKTFGLG